jgi:pimeloyl-ACP methyl ester carboxylesterase
LFTKPATQGPRSLLLVHGAGSGPWVFSGWADAFPGIRTVAVDLHDALDIACASQDDYARAVVDACSEMPAPVALCGWSMGGLVVLQAASRIDLHSVVLLEASAPAEVQGFHPHTGIVGGTFDPEAVYGRFPAGMRARPESVRARAERKRGISVPGIRCPSLVVYGRDFPDERGTRLAGFYGSDERQFPGLDHWGLVRDPRVRSSVADWLGTPCSRSPGNGDIEIVD